VKRLRHSTPKEKAARRADARLAAFSFQSEERAFQKFGLAQI